MGAFSPGITSWPALFNGVSLFLAGGFRARCSFHAWLCSSGFSGGVALCGVRGVEGGGDRGVGGWRDGG